jgi:hypothetical protein
MYGIIETNKQESTGNWVKPVYNWGDLLTANFRGIYVQATRPVDDGGWRLDDNRYMGDIRTEAEGHGFKYGLYILPEGKKVSYAISMKDLCSKVGIQEDKGPGTPTHTLLPAIVIEQWANPLAIQGDFFNYFNEYMLAKFNNVVLGFSKSSLEIMLANSNSEMLKTLALPSVRIWYWRPGLNAQAQNEEFSAMLKAKGVNKTVWLAMTTVHTTQAEWLTGPIPGPTGASGPTGATGPTGAILNKDQRLAVHFKAISDIYNELP